MTSFSNIGSNWIHSLIQQLSTRAKMTTIVNHGPVFENVLNSLYFPLALTINRKEKRLIQFTFWNFVLNSPISIRQKDKESERELFISFNIDLSTSPPSYVLTSMAKILFSNASLENESFWTINELHLYFWETNPPIKGFLSLSAVPFPCFFHAITLPTLAYSLTNEVLLWSSHPNLK